MDSEFLFDFILKFVDRFFVRYNRTTYKRTSAKPRVLRIVLAHELVRMEGYPVPGQKRMTAVISRLKESECVNDRRARCS